MDGDPFHGSSGFTDLSPVFEADDILRIRMEDTSEDIRVKTPFSC